MKLRYFIFLAFSIITLIPVAFFGIWPHSRAFDNEVAGVVQQNTLGVIVLGLITAAVISWIVSGFLSKPILSVVDAARKLTHGDTAARVPAFRWFGSSELKELRNAFNTMADAISRDITEQQRVEEALRESEERFRTFVEYSPTKVHIKDTQGRFVLINKLSEHLIGASSDEVKGKTSAECFPHERATAYMAHDQEVLKTGGAVEREEVFHLEDGVHTFLTVKFPIKDAAGTIVAIGSVGTDITSHKRAETQLHQAQKMEAVGHLTGGVAHDFNNLLAVIIGNLELAEEELRNDKMMHGLISRAIGAASRGADLTQRLLAFSRKQALRPDVVSVCQLLTGMTDLLHRTLGETIVIETFGCDKELFCFADPTQLENALLNLAINARDAMPDGGKLSFDLCSTTLDAEYAAIHADVRPGDYVVITVSDNGTGMSAETRKNAFEPFFTTKDVGAGSGLGLSMVYGFAKQSDGHITIDSNDSEGTSVRLFLPRVDAKESASNSEIETEIKSTDPRAKGETILVVEDEAEVRELAVRHLNNLGYQVLEAGDGAEAIDIATNNGPIDLLLSDVVLPGGLSGPQIGDEVHRRHPNIKIMYMSGYAADVLAMEGKLSDGAELLNKPFRKQELAQRVRAVLETA